MCVCVCVCGNLHVLEFGPFSSLEQTLQHRKHSHLEGGNVEGPKETRSSGAPCHGLIRHCCLGWKYLFSRELRMPSRDSQYNTSLLRNPNCRHRKLVFWGSAALSVRLTRLKPRDPPRTGTYQKQGPMQPFLGGRECRGLYLFQTPNSRSVFCAGVSLNIHSFIHVEGPKEARRLGVLPWVNTLNSYSPVTDNVIRHSSVIQIAEIS